jgi:hypothetical protein
MTNRLPPSRLVRSGRLEELPELDKLLRGRSSVAGAAAAVEAVAVEVEAASRPSRKRLRLPQPKESFRTLATRAKRHPQKSPTEKQS